MRPELTTALVCLSLSGLTSCLPACPACLHSLPPTTFPYPPASSQPASQPTNPLHSAAVTACAACLASHSHAHPLSRATHAPAQPSLTSCPVHARARQSRSVAQRERGSTARPPAAQLCRLVSRIEIPPTASLLNGPVRASVPCATTLLQQHRHACMPLRAPGH